MSKVIKTGDATTKIAKITKVNALISKLKRRCVLDNYIHPVE
jgi:hypothetical protein